MKAPPKFTTITGADWQRSIVISRIRRKLQAERIAAQIPHEKHIQKPTGSRR
jgi:hypothetical protein